MNFSTLIRDNLKHFWRTNLAVVAGVATAVAVLAGALLVGDSVRASLRDLVLGRLGKTDLVIFSSGFFREQLADDLESHELFASDFGNACSLIAIEGVVTRDENKARAGGVQIYGVDERFWKFHGVNVRSPDGNDVLVSPSLAQELGAKSGETLILRIEKPSAIPVESLHGRKEDLGRTIRFTMREVLPSASLGEFSLRPQQGAVRAIFVSLKKLQKNLEQEAKANAILVSINGRKGSQPVLQNLEKILKEKFELADLGLKLRILEEKDAFALESDSAVIRDLVAEKAEEVAGKLRLPASSILAYLANSIRLGDKEIPYSLVGGIESPDGPENKQFIMLTDWAARDLGAKPGDEVSLDYYVWKEEGRLETKQTNFQVSFIFPLKEDRHFAPEYPGITEAKSLADWDPPFPLDLSRVRKVDEEFWDRYRATPKAFIPLEVAQSLWGTRYGKLTSIRFSYKTETLGTRSELEKTRNTFGDELRMALDPVAAGFSIQSVKEQALEASRGATDFGEYFTYFSFFLVISALLLTTLFFRLGIEQRLREIGLLRAIGFSIRQVRSLFLREGAVLALLGSILGAIGAIAYGALIMWGLRTWWVGAVGTTELRLHIIPQSLLIGGLSGIVTAIACIWWTLRSLRSASPRSLLAGAMGSDVRNSAFRQQVSSANPLLPKGGTLNTIFSAGRLALVFGLIGVLLLVSAALNWIGQVGGFFGAGTFLLIAILCFWSAWLKGENRRTIEGQGIWPMALMGFRNASVRPGRSVLCIALIAAASFIIVSVDSFRRDGKGMTLNRQTGNGGYPLMAESLLPIVHDPNSEQGREELNLIDEALHDVKLTRFLLRPGDDASCLNLYQPRNPRILGATVEFIKTGRFAFQSSLARTDEEKLNPWLLLNDDSAIRNSQSPIPVVIDANSMTYVLHKSLGQEIEVNASNGSPLKLRIVAALADSIFQGELLMSEKNFLRYFPDQEGYRVFLIDAAPEKSSGVAVTLEEKLSDFGFDAISTEEKLAGFHQVENTYLSTFQTLGGLGLLLGTIGLAAVLLRNVLERRKELALMRAMGYQPSHLSLVVIAENALLLGCGLLSGAFCALLAIFPAISARGGRLSVVSLGMLLLSVLITGMAASLIAVRVATRSPLLPSLRTE